MATFCIPNAPGVPGLSGQPPYWLPSGPYPQRTELDDPRWRGAYRRNFDDGLVFRAVYDQEGGQTSLYLSWNALFVPQLDDADDVLYLGLQSGAGGDAMVLRIEAHGTPVLDPTIPMSTVSAVEVFTNAGGPWGSVPEPAWIADNTRSWMTLTGGAAGLFAVQMRIPISSAGGITNAAGPELGDDPNVWFFVTGGASGSIIEMAEAPDLGTTIGDVVLNTFPSPGSWDRLSTIPGDAACPTTGGVALQNVDVGTTNAVVSRIEYDSTVPVGSRPVNTFFARPRNYTAGAIAAGDIRGRFRLANWGSIADPNADWVDIPGGGLVASDAAIGTLPPGGSPPATNPIHFDWRLDDTDIATFITGSVTHKCILVELDGANLTFFNESVYRNMDFVGASRFERAAEISVRGLTPTAGPRRDVYLAIEQLNMPTQVQPGDGEDTVEIPVYGVPGQDGPDVRAARADGHTRTVSRKEALALAKRGALPADVVQTFMPTYRVHVYHDTGRVHDGKTVLRPQATYGYFVEHDGPLVGWQDALDAPAAAQLTQIAPQYYRIAVPHNGSTSVQTVIEAKEEHDGPSGDNKGCLTALFRLFRK